MLIDWYLTLPSWVVMGEKATLGSGSASWEKKNDQNKTEGLITVTFLPERWRHSRAIPNATQARFQFIYIPMCVHTGV